MTRRTAGQAITHETLAALTERHGERWRLWPSAEGRFACATLRRGLSWVRSRGRNPVGLGGCYVRTLVEDSPEDLAAAIDRENDGIARLLAEGTLRMDR